MKGWIIWGVIMFLLVYLLLVGLNKWISSSARSAAVKDHDVVLIDGCEYILISGYNQIAIAHKGDCTNEYHRR